MRTEQAVKIGDGNFNARVIHALM